MPGCPGKHLGTLAAPSYMGYRRVEATDVGGAGRRATAGSKLSAVKAVRTRAAEPSQPLFIDKGHLMLTVPRG